jgi:hypothetical protein
MAAICYNRAKNNINIADLRVLLLVGYTPDVDHTTLTAVIAAATKECDFTNYARKALTGEAFSVDNGTDTGKLDADNPSTWSDAGGASNNEVSHAVVFEHVDADDDNNLPVSCHSVGITTNGGDLTVAFADAGILVTS